MLYCLLRPLPKYIIEYIMRLPYHNVFIVCVHGRIKSTAILNKLKLFKIQHLNGRELEKTLPWLPFRDTQLSTTFVATSLETIADTKQQLDQY